MSVRRMVVMVLLVLAGLFCAGQPALAQVVPTRKDADAMRDILQTIQARKLLLEDSDLASLNIGVVVLNRVAILWGPVPSAESAYRAELCLRTMIELVEIRNDLFVSEEPEPVKNPLKIDNKPLPQPEPMPPKLPQEQRPLVGAPGTLMRHDLSDLKQKTAVVAKASPVLGSPQPDQQVTAPLEPEPALSAAVRKVLQSKSAYREVQFAVKEERVYLRAASEDAEALQEAAHAIAQLPNVVGVVLLEKTSPR